MGLLKSALYWHQTQDAMAKAIFFDRDGTLIDEPSGEGTVNEWNLFKLKPDLASLKELEQDGYLFFIVTNQPALSTGRLSRDFYDQSNEALLKSLPITIEKIFTCPHTKDTPCTCRKPQAVAVPQMIAEYGIEPGDSYTVGDRRSDVELGRRYGLRTILVSNPHLDQGDIRPDYFADNLAQAVRYIISNEHGQRL